MNTTLKYVLKVWLTSILLAPTLIVFTDQEFEGNKLAIFALTLGSMAIGSIFSAPSAGLLWLTVSLTSKFTVWRLSGQKLLWSVIAVALSILPFIIFDMVSGVRSGIDSVIISIPACYAAIIVAGIWFYKFPCQVKRPRLTY